MIRRRRAAQAGRTASMKAAMSCSVGRLRLQFEYGTSTMNAAIRRDAVKITRAIEDDSSGRAERLVAILVEAVQDLFRPVTIPSRTKLEDGAVAVDASCAGDAVEVAGGVPDETGVAVLTVVGASEIVQHALRPRATAVGD